MTCLALSHLTLTAWPDQVSIGTREYGLGLFDCPSRGNKESGACLTCLYFPGRALSCLQLLGFFAF